MAIDFESIDGPWLDDLLPHELPRQYQELASLIGCRSTMIVACVLGGGGGIYIPKADALVRIARDKKIREDRKRGMSYADLVRKYNLTDVWIRQICDHRGDDDKQQDLF